MIDDALAHDRLNFLLGALTAVAVLAVSQEVTAWEAPEDETCDVY